MSLQRIDQVREEIICGTRVPCGGRLRRAREGIEWLAVIGVSTVPHELKAVELPPACGQTAQGTRETGKSTSREIYGCASNRVLRSKIMYLGRAACDGQSTVRSKFIRFLSSIRAEARFAGYITRDDCSAPVRGADPLRQKRAHAQRPASRADRRLDPRIWLHQPGAAGYIDDGAPQGKFGTTSSYPMSKRLTGQPG